MLPLISVAPEIVLFGTTTAAVPAESVTVSPGSVSGVGGSSGSESPRAAADFDVAARALTAPEGGAKNGPQILSPRLDSNSNLPEKRIRKKRKGKDPVVVEGDNLANTPKMIALVWSSLALNLAYLLQVTTAVPPTQHPYDVHPFSGRCGVERTTSFVVVRCGECFRLSLGPRVCRM